MALDKCYELYWLWLSERVGIASKELPKLMEQYTDPYDIYRLETEEIERLEGISSSLKQRLSDKSVDRAYTLFKYCRNNKIKVIGYGDADYPSRLRTISDPPVLLYCKGSMPSMNEKLCIGMVGTRNISEYGKHHALKLSYELGAAGVCVVSGMALGIDGVSACGVLEAGGKTVAVLGCGLATVYPKQHAQLMRAIAKNGAVVSEYPPFEKPNAWNFPKRNRIISGMCQGVVIIEGTRKSGSMITAKAAIEQGREVFALPGHVDDCNAEGTNELIHDGANVVLDTNDILDHYDFLYSSAIDRGGLARAKNKFKYSDHMIKRYGVSADVDTGDKKPKWPVSTEVSDKFFKYVPESEKREKITAEQCRKDVLECADEAEDKSDMERYDDVTQLVYKLMPDGEPITADKIIPEGVTPSQVITSLTLLEIGGEIRSLPGGMYVKI